MGVNALLLAAFDNVRIQMRPNQVNCVAVVRCREGQRRAHNTGSDDDNTRHGCLPLWCVWSRTLNLLTSSASRKRMIDIQVVWDKKSVSTAHKGHTHEHKRPRDTKDIDQPHIPLVQ